MIVGITPARGGSKGLPGKNIRPLLGKPLLAWTMESAKSSKLLGRYVVSTEDQAIAGAARSHGVEVVDRPKELASDEASTIEVLQHVLTVIPAEVVVLLQATCPVRGEGLIDACIHRFRTSGADSLATGFMCKYLEYGSDKEERRRQDIPGFFYDDGNVYVFKSKALRRGDRYGRRVEHFLTGREENIDIDDEFDFWLAEQVLSKRLIPPQATGFEIRGAHAMTSRGISPSGEGQGRRR